MCGIAGWVQYKNGALARPRDLDRMVEALKHRGPDDDGYYRKGPAALGMRRLSIVDLPRGHQPMTNERGNIWVVYNGEIYNHQEIRSSLVEYGHAFRTNADTEVLLHAYEEYGESFIAHLRGIFAFALWDETYQRLLLARDHLGVKPLYYTLSDGNLLFASEVKSLLENPLVKREVDAKQLLSLLTLQYVPSPDTPFRGIRKLPPGHVLRVEKGKVASHSYWTPRNPHPEAFSPGHRVSKDQEREWVDEMRLKFFQSVKEQLMADVPVGAFLSGGVDSSFVVASIAHQTHKSVKTYSVGFPHGKAFNELAYARRVAKQFKCQHREMMVDAQMLPDLLPRLAKYQDDPVVDPAVIPTFLVSLLARQEVKAVLTGEGADELFGGYRRYAYDRLAKPAGFLPGWLKTRVIPFFMRRGSERYQQAWDALSETDALKRHLTWARLCPRETLEGLAGEKLRYELENQESDEMLSKVFEEGRAFSPDSLTQMLYTDIKTWLPDDLLTKVDRMSMAASLEARVPYLDVRLVEFALGLPPSMKLRGGKGKFILKQAAQRYLPYDIVHRPKQGFAVPLGPWFRKELKDLVIDTLSEVNLRKRGLFDPVAANRILVEHMSGRQDHHLLLFGMLMIEWWYQEYVD